MLRVVGKSWQSLKGLTLPHKCLDIIGCRDIPLFHPRPHFPLVHKVFVRDCDRNFVNNWLEKSQFPKVKTIYLDIPDTTLLLPVAQRFNSTTHFFLKSSDLINELSKLENDSGSSVSRMDIKVIDILNELQELEETNFNL